MNMTRRCREYIENKCFVVPFTQLSAQSGVPETTIRRIADNLVLKLDQSFSFEIPEIVAIDNIHLPSGKDARVQLENLGKFPKKKTHICYTAIYDGETSQIIDLLDERSLDGVLRYLLNLKGSSRIKFVAMDMDKIYRQAVWVAFGDKVKIVVDRWHVTQQINSVMDKTRRKLDPKQKKLAKPFSLDLKTSESSLRRKNLKRYHELMEMLSNAPQLERTYRLKENLLSVYESQGKSTAIQRYKKWLIEIEKSDVTGFRRIKSMIEEWEEQIFNYWECGKLEKILYSKPKTLEELKYFESRSKSNYATLRWKGLNSGLAEARNNVIRTINRVGRSYSYRFMRARAMFSTYDVNKEFGICEDCHHPFIKDIRSKDHFLDERFAKAMSSKGVRNAMTFGEVCGYCGGASSNVRRCESGPVGRLSARIGLSHIWRFRGKSIAGCREKLNDAQRRYQARSREKFFGSGADQNNETQRSFDEIFIRT